MGDGANPSRNPQTNLSATDANDILRQISLAQG
jgi:hypothetical protein